MSRPDEHPQTARCDEDGEKMLAGKPRTPLATLVLLVAFSLSVLSLFAPPAFADDELKTDADDELKTDDGLTKDQERAVKFCVDFADVVKSNAPDCKAMAASLDDLIERNEAFVQRVATHDNAKVRERCTLALEEAVDGLMVCAESKELNDALARLAAIEEQSPAATEEKKPAQATRTTKPELAQLQLFCADFSTAVSESPANDCNALADKIDPVTKVHSGLFSRWAENSDVDASEKQLFATAMAQCMEAMVAIPERCQNNERIQTALRRLDE